MFHLFSKTFNFLISPVCNETRLHFLKAVKVRSQNCDFLVATGSIGTLFLLSDAPSAPEKHHFVQYLKPLCSDPKIKSQGTDKAVGLHVEVSGRVGSISARDFTGIQELITRNL